MLQIDLWNNESGVSAEFKILSRNLWPHTTQFKMNCAVNDVDGDHPREPDNR